MTEDILRNLEMDYDLICADVDDAASDLIKIRRPTDPAQIEREGVLIAMIDPYYADAYNVPLAKKYLDRMAALLYSTPLIQPNINYTITNLIQQANKSLFEFNQRQSIKYNFGLGFLLIHKASCYYLNLGGSRFFLHRGDRVKVLDADLETGQKVLGLETSIDVHVGRFNYEEGDVLVLASKQIMDHFKDEEIASLIISNPSSIISRRLIDTLRQKLQDKLLKVSAMIIPFKGEVKEEEAMDDIDTEEYKPKNNSGFLKGILLGLAIGILLAIVAYVVNTYVLTDNMKSVKADPKEEARIAKQDSIMNAKRDEERKKQLDAEKKKQEDELFSEELLAKTDKYLSTLERKYNLKVSEEAKNDDASSSDQDQTTTKGKKKKVTKKPVKEKKAKPGKDTIEKKITALRANYNELKDNTVPQDKVLDQTRLLVKFIDNLPAPSSQEKGTAKRKQPKKTTEETSSADQEWGKEHSKLVLYETYHSRLLVLYYQVVMLMKTEGVNLQ